MSCRIEGFDYSSPYFYMVTIKRQKGYPDFFRAAKLGGTRPYH